MKSPPSQEMTPDECGAMATALRRLLARWPARPQVTETRDIERRWIIQLAELCETCYEQRGRLVITAFLEEP